MDRKTDRKYTDRQKDRHANKKIITYKERLTDKWIIRFTQLKDYIIYRSKMNIMVTGQMIRDLIRQDI